LNAGQTKVGQNDVRVLGRPFRQRFLSGTIPGYHLHTWRAADKCREALASLPLIFDKDNSDGLRHRDQSM
jgi:hypothetical protein